MNECRRIAERLAAYTDDSLPAADLADVERHLSACAPCRRSASHEREARAVLRAQADRLRAQPLPPGLRSRCEALAREHARGPARATWRSRLVPAAVAAILIVFTGAAIFSLATRRSDALLAAQLAADHARCFRNFVSPDSPGLDASAVEAALAEQYGWNLHVPPSSGADGVRLIHARRCLYADGRLPHLLYRVNGQDVSLFMLEGVARKAADVTAFGHRSRIWTRGATTFVLVSPTAARDLDSAVRYVVREAR